MSEMRPPDRDRLLPRTPRGYPAAAAYPDGAYADPQDGEVLDIGRLVRVLRRHAVLVALVTLGCFALTLYFVLTETPRYTAVASFQIDDAGQQMVGGLTQMSGMPGGGADVLATQMQIVRSRSVVGAVVDREGLRAQPAADEEPVPVRLTGISGSAEHVRLALAFAPTHYTARAGADTASAPYGEPVRVAGLEFAVAEHPGTGAAELQVISREAAIDGVISNLSARARPNTFIVDIEYVAEDSVTAQRVVNGVVRAFVTHSLQAAQQASALRIAFLSEQLAQTDSALAEAQSALSGFRSTQRVASSGERLGAQQAGLMGIEVRREELAAERTMYGRLLNTLATASAEDRQRSLRTLVSAPGIASNPIISELYSQLVQYENQRSARLAGEWGSAATNPEIQRLDVLIASTKDDIIAAAESHLAFVDARLSALEDLQTRSGAALAELPALQSEEERLALQAATVREMSAQLREEYQRARLAQAVETGDVQVLDLATRPGTPVDSRRGMKLALGLAIGLMLGTAIALMRDQLNTTITNRDEMEQALGLAPLAVIPRIAAANGARNGRQLRLPVRSTTKPHARVERPGSELITIRDGHSSGAEAYRTLRTNLIFSQAAQSVSSMMVTSSVAAEGKTTTATNLAVAYAQQGLRVIVLDCDLRKARMHRVFGMSREPGLVDVLMRTVDLDSVIRATQVDGLSVVTAGTLPPNPAELLGSNAMRKLLPQLVAMADLVIVDAPPVLVAGDASIVGALVDGAIVVVRAGQTETAAAQAAVEQLNVVGTRIIGTVLNDPDAKLPKYDGERYYYAHSYYGDSED